MNRSAVQIDGCSRQLHQARRRGGIFGYFMVYLMLAGAVSASAGAMLHIMMKNQSADLRHGESIRQLIRLEHELRSDCRSAQDVGLQDGALQLHSPNEHTVAYTVEDHVVRRETSSVAGELQSLERFEFTKGTTMTFLPSPDQVPRKKSFLFRLVSPVPAQRKQSSQLSESGRSVDFFLVVTDGVQKKAEPDDEE